MTINKYGSVNGNGLSNGQGNGHGTGHLQSRNGSTLGTGNDYKYKPGSGAAPEYFA